MRLSKDVNGEKTTHVWDGSNIVLEYGANNAVYLRGINLIKKNNNEYYLFNVHSDVVQTVNNGGSLVKAYVYDAFGNEENPDANDMNPWRYCAEYFDSSSGNYYLKQRYYQPKTGRLLQQDLWEYADPNDPLSLNLYIYCYNNPIFWVDPTGHSAESATIAIRTFIDQYKGTTKWDEKTGIATFTIGKTTLTSLNCTPKVRQKI